jgi:hypothetical protein
MPQGFETVAAITKDKPKNEFQIDELNRKLVIKLNGTWYTIAVTCEFDQDFNSLKWRYDPKQLMERLTVSKSHTVTLTSKGIVEGLVD